MKNFLLYAILLVLFASCSQEQKNTITNPEDYNAYLDNQKFQPTSKYFNLWNDKIKPDSLQTLSLAIVAGEYNRYFKSTGDISYLKKAEAALSRALEIGAIGKASYLRALARNYISQHRFKEADSLALLAESIGSGLRETHALRFDTSMELGNYERAEAYLDSLKNMDDFGYQVRLAKFNDYKGDLLTAIRILEKAALKAEKANNKDLMMWSYTNLADYYGHAGRIAEAYQLYLKALDLNPGSAYAKKGIAWIVYSYEKNPEEALRILDSITAVNTSPDYFLLKAEIASFANLESRKAIAEDAYLKYVSDPGYGSMYNLVNASWFMHENPEKAMELAQREIENRSTPETNSVLALAKAYNGQVDEAVNLIEKAVFNKSSEPLIMLAMAQVLKEAGNEEAVAEIKMELLEADFELGPVTMQKVNSL